MEEYINRLVTITHIKKAISNYYSSTDTTNIYHECMELINDIEEEVILKVVVHNDVSLDIGK